MRIFGQNAEMCRYTRSGTVAEEVLGQDFGGIVSCDCYGGYNRLLADKQRCWAHPLRDLHGLKEQHADPRGGGVGRGDPGAV